MNQECRENLHLTWLLQFSLNRKKILEIGFKLQNFHMTIEHLRPFKQWRHNTFSQTQLSFETIKIKVSPLLYPYLSQVSAGASKLLVHQSIFHFVLKSVMPWLNVQFIFVYEPFLPIVCFVSNASTCRSIVIVCKACWLFLLFVLGKLASTVDIVHRFPVVGQHWLSLDSMPGGQVILVFLDKIFVDLRGGQCLIFIQLK